MKCKVEGCNKLTHGRGLCNTHYKRWWHTSDPTHPDKRQGYWINNGYIMFSVNGRHVYEHIYKAEKALGKQLPPGACVHHMNELRWDNETPFNLVICPDQAYHSLLHKRMKALGYENN